MYENDSYMIKWRGFVFIPGFRNGNDSIEHLAHMCSNTCIMPHIHKLKGHYVMEILEKKSGLIHIFTDNAGLYVIYYGNGVISNSFLDIVKHSCSIDPLGLIEFISFGKNFNNRTYVKQVKSLQFSEMILIKNNTMIVKKKQIPFIRHGRDYIFKFMEGMESSLSGKTVCADITAGADSRIIAALAAKYADNVVLAVSGPDSYGDVITARDIAIHMDKKLIVTVHSIDHLDKDVNTIFEYMDGLGDFSQFHRSYMHEQRRRIGNVDIVLTGEGGVLLKDYWWKMDFPFYGRRKPDMKKLYNIVFRKRFMDDSLLGMKGFYLKNLMGKTIKNEIQKCYFPSNRMTYDEVYYRYYASPKVRRMTTSIINNFHYHYNPIEETEIVQMAMTIPKGLRMWNNYHRYILSKVNPGLATIPCNGHFTLQQGNSYIIRDFFNIIAEKTTYYSQRFISNPKPDMDKYDTRIYDYMRNRKEFDNAMKYLSDRGLLKKSVGPKNVPDNKTGSIFTIGLFLEQHY